MKTNPFLAGLTAVLFGIWPAAARAEEVAVVTDRNVNVRGQPSLIGEVITQLQKDEKVILLEEIPVEKPKTNEPAKWARIQMPANTPVWVFAPFIDPNTKTVTANRLNLRAGPGENYSVVGRLEKGDTVKDIRTVEEWMEIETPAKAYAFVAAEYLTKLATNAPPALAKRTDDVPAATKTDPAPPPLVLEKPKEETVTSAPTAQAQPAIAPTFTGKPAGVATQEIPSNPVAVTETPAVSTNSTTNLPASNATATPADPAASPPATITELPPKRIVRREGIVRGTRSIQAPSWFELVSPDTRKVINYLHTDDPALKLKDFKGKKIIVTGEEGIDSRWPQTPIIEIETLDIVP